LVAQLTAQAEVRRHLPDRARAKPRIELEAIPKRRARDVAAHAAEPVESPLRVLVEVPPKMQAVGERRTATHEERAALAFDRDRVGDVAHETVVHDLLARRCHELEANVI